MARKHHEPKRPGKPIDLKRGRITKLPRMGICFDEGKLKDYLQGNGVDRPDLTIVSESHNGKLRLRVWADGVEIEHFRVNQ